MSLDHEFYLVQSNIKVDSWEKWRRENMKEWTEKVYLEYDFIFFIEPFLGWVPSFDPESGKEWKGINRYGITLFKEKSFGLLIEVLDSLIKLFSIAPQSFFINGDTVWKEDEGGYWETLNVEVNKNEIYTKLETLRSFAVFAKDNNYYIFHYGI